MLSFSLGPRPPILPYLMLGNHLTLTHFLRRSLALIMHFV